MATNDRFIQSIVELLDKLIDHQSKSTMLISEIKSSSNELRTDLTEALRHLREKLPETIRSSSEIDTEEIASLLSRMDNSNQRVVDQIIELEKHKVDIDRFINLNSDSLDENKKILLSIKSTVENNNQSSDTSQDSMKETIKNVNSFIDGLKSKKVWIGLIVAGIAALATAVSSITNAINAIEGLNKDNQKTQIVTPSKDTTPPK